MASQLSGLSGGTDVVSGEGGAGVPGLLSGAGVVSGGGGGVVSDGGVVSGGGGAWVVSGGGLLSDGGGLLSGAGAGMPGVMSCGGLLSGAGASAGVLGALLSGAIGGVVVVEHPDIATNGMQSFLRGVHIFHSNQVLYYQNRQQFLVVVSDILLLLDL
jgi:hypothetical protein